jgi:hypothetical protein
MQDLPEGSHQEWIRTAKKCIQWAQERVSAREEYLKGILSEIEELTAKNFQEEFLNSETEKI